jgi:LTXXQ motif family protein
MRCLTLAAALLLTALSPSSFAQSPADHEAHHPRQQDAAPTQPTPPANSSGTAQGMGGGIMNMMGGNMPVMNMMQMTGARQGDCGMGGMGMIDRVEGRIAFLRAELKITDPQNAVWDAFADALRANATSLGEARTAMMSQAGTAQGLVDRLTLQEKWLTVRLEGTHAIKSALTSLVGALSDEQKKTADQLLAVHMGMGAMACAMQARQMGSGQMQPGAMMQGR